MTLAKRKRRTLIPPKRRVSKEARIWRVHDLKVADHTDREIVKLLEEDAENPTSVSHQQVNLDSHETLNILRIANEGHSQRQRQLALTRLDALLRAVWDKAVAGDLDAVGQGRLLIADMRRIQGLDGPELGDPERPIHVEERVTVDYSKLPTEDLLHLKRIAEANGNVIDGIGGVVG
jgi:hypothetical protein